MAKVKRLTMLAEARRFVSRVKRCAPFFRPWKIRVVMGSIEDDKELANVRCDYEEKRALITINEFWQDRTNGTLQERVAHELGHLFVADVMGMLQAAAKKIAKEADEHLASRVGLLLIEMVKLAERK